MKLRDFGEALQNEKKTVHGGMILLAFAALLGVFLLRLDFFEDLWKTLLNALKPVFGGIVVAYVLNVFVHFFEDLAFRPFAGSKSKVWAKAKRPVAVVLAYLVVILLIVFITCFIIPSLIGSLEVLAETARQTVPGFVNTALRWVNDFAQEYGLDFLQEHLKSFNWASLLSNVTKVTTDFLGSLVSMTFNLASGLFSMIMGLIFSIYMLFGKEKLVRGVKATLLAFLPEKTARKAGWIGSMANKVFFSFIKGQLTECVILGMLCYTGMSILRLDYALLISSVVALGALIPILGAYIGAAVGVIVLLMVRPLDSLIFLIFLVILQQLEGNLIYPRVVGSSIGLPPVWTLFAVVFWGGMLGIPGILIGTPATAVLYRLLRTSVRTRLHQRGLDPADPRLAEDSPFEEAAAETAQTEQPESAETGE